MTSSPQPMHETTTVPAKSAANLFTREDTLLGVCQGLGEDFGINPLWFRLAFIAPLFFFPAETILAYLGIGLVLMVMRWAIPVRSPALAPVSAHAPAMNDEEKLPIAA